MLTQIVNRAAHLVAIFVVSSAINSGLVQVAANCQIHTIEGLTATSDDHRFIRLREDVPVGKRILELRTQPRAVVNLKSAEGNGDHKYFSLTEYNSTVLWVTLNRSLEQLVDRDVPQNLLKFHIICASKSEKVLDESSFALITIYIEDINDNAPEFLNTPYIVDVAENTPPGEIVFTGIKAFDRDKPNTPNSQVHFSLSSLTEQLSADGTPYFALKSPHHPLVVLQKSLDFDNGIRVFQLLLLAWDRGTPANQVNTTLTINVRDVDDMPPKFTEGVYRAKISEFSPISGLPIRIPLYFSPPIMAYDQDSLNATLVYDIISGNERKLFRVNPHNGIVYLQKEIDLEEESLPGNTFVLQIEARQKNNALKKAVARIEVEILDLNDNVPEFEADYYNISIVENLPTGFSVLQVNAVDRDQGENAEFAYHLTEEKDSLGAFLIDSRTGWITVHDDHLLDREKRKSIHLGVEALERNRPYLMEKGIKPPSPSAVKVEITLLDTNDNTPKFERGNLYEFKVAITTPVGESIGQVVAFDPDEGPNGKLRYELQRPKGSGYIPFQLDRDNGTLYVSGPLRRGRIAVFVEASDQPLNPSERRFSLAVITIEVYATIDDQAIEFLGAPYEFWVGSNIPLGTSVGQVRTTLGTEAEDEIMFDLLHTYSEGVPFAIEERSGIITVIRELTEFTRTVYYFEAVANYIYHKTNTSRMDSHSPILPLATMTELTDEGVLITNVTIYVVPTKPENRVSLKPVIEEINSNIIKFHVEENVAGGIIGQLLYKNGINVLNNYLGSVRDLKTHSNASASATVGRRFRSRHQPRNSSRRVSRRLIEDTNIKLRYIIANQQEVVNKITITEDGTLLTLTALDREQQSKYDLTVIVEYTTEGLMSGAGIYQVNVQVDDVNDNAPQFSDQLYLALINENSPKGTELALHKHIHVTDADEGKNAEFRLLLQGDYHELFTIDVVNNTSTGVMNIFNLTDQWHEDLGFGELQAAFVQSVAHAKQKLERLYRISYTGKQNLDRERDQLYKLKILAVDSGGLSSYANLHVLIADVNDNAPIFERISVFKDSKMEIREYTTDMEIYFVESVYPTAMQTLPAATVVVPPYHMPGSPRLHSGASFNSTYQGRARLRTHILKRKLRAVTPFKPTLKCPLFAILEDSPLGTKVLQVTASDEDYGKNAQIHYDLTDEHVERPTGGSLVPKTIGAKHFSLDKISGELAVNFPLAAQLEIRLNLSATDIDGLKDTTCLRFTVIDVNNHAPTFKKSWYSFDIEEGTYNDSVLGQVLAFDLDYGWNANITYSLVEQDLPFKVKPVSGVIKINGMLDRELHEKYNFHITATDNAEPLYRMSSTVEVEVNVQDINDNTPEFIGYDETATNSSLPVYKAYLDRSTNPGMFVKQITAIDKDFPGNGNGLVLYSISQQDTYNAIFQIDSRDGTITTVGNFRSYNDYEHLNLTVVAADLGIPVRSASAIVLINLQGQAIEEEPSTPSPIDFEEKNITLFQHQYYEIELAENNAEHTELIKINLTAGAKAENYHWTLSMETEPVDAASALFEFSTNESTLYARRRFDRELQAKYQLRMRADREKDRSREARMYSKIAYPVLDERVEDLAYNECRLVLHILDENDNAPKFRGNGQPIIAVVPRGATYGYPVTTVEATDADAGLNAEIRYRLLNEPAKLFAIDEMSGSIRLIANVPLDERVYGFDVKATDRGGDDNGRSSIANVFVYIIDEARQVRIVVAGRPLEVEKKIDALLKLISEAIQMDVRVRVLQPHNGAEPATDVFIYAVDFRTNAIMEMEELQETLASLQLDALQLQQRKAPNSSAQDSPPRVIELAEFGHYDPSGHGSPSFMAGLEILFILLIVLCFIGAILTTLCFLCLRQKRGVWSQQEFSEAGLAYGITRAGLKSCHRSRSLGRHEPRNCLKSGKTLNSFIPESVCSSAQTQSTLAASQKFDPHLQLHQHHHHHHHNQQHNHQQKREYIDVPLPKSLTKSLTKPPLNRSLSLEHDVGTSQVMLKYNDRQPESLPTNPYESSMFSLHSSGHDSGIDFRSSRELCEAPPDAYGFAQKSTSAQLCPRHAKAIERELPLDEGKGLDGSSNYYKDLSHKTSNTADSTLVAPNYRNPTQGEANNYQNGRFKKRSCVRHSFSGVKDDLVQNSPEVTLRPRGHSLRHSMNDLEERLHNLEQSFSRRSFGKTHSLL